MAARRKSAEPRPAQRRPAKDDREAEEQALEEELFRAVEEERADWAAGLGPLLKQLGITAKPIGGKKLRERLLKKGFDPNSNEFSRGIIAMREE